jgi:uncharacterized membrane protein (DUF106 family)
MTALNSALRWFFGLLLRPLSGTSPLFAILLWSLLTAIFALLVYKRTSDQDALDAVKRKIHACIFEIRLFNDDLVAIIRAQLEILRHNLSYFRLSLKPMIFMLPPLVLIIAQLHYYYGFRALAPGETTLLKVELSEDWQAATPNRPDLSLDLPAGLIAETEALWTPQLSQMMWRIRATEQGLYDIGIDVAGERFSKRLLVTDRVLQLAPVRPPSGALAELEFPSEAPLPEAAPVRSISIDYPDAELSLLGMRYQSEWAWMILYFALTMVLAFALRKPFGVTI